MKDKTLLSISLIMAIIGILLLLILANTIQPEKINIKDITKNQLDKKVQTQGKITSIRNYPESNFEVLTIQDKDNNKTIQVIFNPNNNINLTKNQTILITGTVSQYKESLQIQGDKIQVLSLNTNKN